ncbi:hypothetical protein [Kingella kingae]|nr:hypothetical protein [Kingella kingae]MDK4575035.1 hypothetical protein [Kingella kingae]
MAQSLAIGHLFVATSNKHAETRLQRKLVEIISNVCQAAFAINHNL